MMMHKMLKTFKSTFHERRYRFLNSIALELQKYFEIGQQKANFLSFTNNEERMKNKTYQSNMRFTKFI